MSVAHQVVSLLSAACSIELPVRVVGVYMDQAFERRVNGGSVLAIWLQPWSKVNVRAWAIGF